MECLLNIRTRDCPLCRGIYLADPLRRCADIARFLQNAEALTHQPQRDQAIRAVLASLEPDLTMGVSAAYVIRAKALIALADFKGAEEAFRRALEIHRCSNDAFIGLVDLLYSQGNLEELRVLLDEMLPLPYLTAEQLRKSGHMQLKLGKPAVAREAFERCLALKPNCGISYANMGEALVALGNFKDAEVVLRRGLQPGIENRQESARLILIHALLHQRKFAEAVPGYVALPEDAKQKLVKKFTSTGLLEFAKALPKTELNRLAVFAATQAGDDWIIAEGCIRELSGDSEGAIAALRKLVMTDAPITPDSRAHRELSTLFGLLKKLNKLDEAADILEYLIPRTSITRPITTLGQTETLLSAVLLNRRGKYQAALHLLTVAGEIWKNNFEIRVKQAAVLAAMGSYTEADAHARAALNISKGDEAELEAVLLICTVSAKLPLSYGQFFLLMEGKQKVEALASRGFMILMESAAKLKPNDLSLALEVTREQAAASTGDAATRWRNAEAALVKAQATAASTTAAETDKDDDPASKKARTE